jgi:hypothetical protein
MSSLLINTAVELLIIVVHSIGRTRIGTRLHRILHAQWQRGKYIQPRSRLDSIHRRAVAGSGRVQAVVIRRVDSNHPRAVRDAAHVVITSRQHHHDLPAV